jgi:hypothetical protein
MDLRVPGVLLLAVCSPPLDCIRSVLVVNCGGPPTDFFGSQYVGNPALPSARSIKGLDDPASGGFGIKLNGCRLTPPNTRTATDLVPVRPRSLATLRDAAAFIPGLLGN